MKLHWSLPRGLGEIRRIFFFKYRVELHKTLNKTFFTTADEKLINNLWKISFSHQIDSSACLLNSGFIPKAPYLLTSASFSDSLFFLLEQNSRFYITIYSQSILTADQQCSYLFVKTLKCRYLLGISVDLSRAKDLRPWKPDAFPFDYIIKS